MAPLKKLRRLHPCGSLNTLQKRGLKDSLAGGIMQKKIYLTFLFITLFLTGCTPWVNVVVQPENFTTVRSQFDTFLFGTYVLDNDEGIYFDLHGLEPDLQLNRVYTHPFAPGQPDVYLIPIPAGTHLLRSIYFTSGPV